DRPLALMGSPASEGRQTVATDPNMLGEKSGAMSIKRRRVEIRSPRDGFELSEQSGQPCGIGRGHDRRQAGHLRIQRVERPLDSSAGAIEQGELQRVDTLGGGPRSCADSGADQKLTPDETNDVLNVFTGVLRRG